MQQKSASMEWTNDSTKELRAQRRELLQELTRQAEARRQQVRQMLTQSAESREKEATELRDSRFETLKKISAEVSQNRNEARTQLEQMAKVRPEGVRGGGEAEAAPVKATEVAKPVERSEGASGGGKEVVRRWTPGQWVPRQRVSGKTVAGAGPETVSQERPEARPEAVVTAEVSPVHFVQPGSEKPVEPPVTVVAATGSVSPIDQRILELEERYSKLVGTLQDQFDLTAKLESLATRLEREWPGQLERRLSEESARLTQTLSGHWQADLATALERLPEVPSTSPDVAPTEALVEKLATEFQSFAGEFANRLAAFDAQTAAHQMQQRRIEKLEVMLTEHATAMQGTPTEVAALQARLGRVEAGLVRAINLLQHSGNSAIAEEMQSRMERIETGVNELLESMEKQSKAPRGREGGHTTGGTEPSPIEPSATELLSSLSRLMGGLKQAQSERMAQERQSEESQLAGSKTY